MDDLVVRAMLKWPHVPDCYGWLGLDARGRWFMRDDASQLAGDFASGNLLARGSELKHEKLIQFIERNYGADDDGQWFFQNGPQRVFVELQATPWIWRMDDQFGISAHTGQVTHFVSALLDENGWLYLNTDLGVGLLHSQDVLRAEQAIERKGWELQQTTIADIVQRFGFVKSPLLRQRSKSNNP